MSRMIWAMWLFAGFNGKHFLTRNTRTFAEMRGICISVCSAKFRVFRVKKQKQMYTLLHQDAHSTARGTVELPAGTLLPNYLMYDTMQVR